MADEEKQQQPAQTPVEAVAKGRRMTRAEDPDGDLEGGGRRRLARRSWSGSWEVPRRRLWRLTGRMSR